VVGGGGRAVPAAANAPRLLPCGSCYGAEAQEGDCCRTCHDVKVRYAARGWDTYNISREAAQCLRELNHPEIAMQAGEGCVLDAKLEVNKVAGTFQVALGTSRQVSGNQLVHTFQVDKLAGFDTS